MSFGVTEQGFISETFSDLVTDLEQALQAEFGTNIDVSATSVWGQIIQITAERLADLWDAAGSIYASWTPEGAFGASLDNLCALTGTVRNPANYSTALLGLTGTNNTLVPAANVASVGPQGNRFLTLATATIVTVPTWAGVTTYAAGALVTNGGNVYYTNLGGVSAASGGPGGSTPALDGNITWIYLGVGTAGVMVPAQATTAGPLLAVAGALTYIATPVAGWNAVINPLDATLGANIEADAALRLRRETELHQSGSAVFDAVAASVEKVPGVTGCDIFDNPEDTTDSNGVPPHAFETLVSGSFDAQAVGAVIWKTKPLGIKAYGANSVTVVDSKGNNQTVGYSVPTEQDVYLVINLTVDQDIWNTSNVIDKQNEILGNVLIYGSNTYVDGKNVVASALEAQCFSFGVLEAACNIGLAPSPSTRNTIAVNTRQFAKLDSSRITFNVSYGVP